MNKSSYHTPVMPDECIDHLNIKPDGIYIDGTCGGGGHSVRIAERLVTGRLIAIDRDGDAVTETENALINLSCQTTIARENFINIPAVLDDLSIDLIDGCLLDLGASSYQLDTMSRGFSYIRDARLDMRMDTRQKLTAYEVVNSYDEEKLKRLIYTYGEERWAGRIAMRIVKKRTEGPIVTTGELAGIIETAMPPAARRGESHPAQKTFMAIRIEVNSELEFLEASVVNIINRLKRGGRIVVLTFHSLEDRIIKNVFIKLSGACVCPPGLPVCACGADKKIKIITKKPIEASAAETAANTRAHSAKLRAAERN